MATRLPIHTTHDWGMIISDLRPTYLRQPEVLEFIPGTNVRQAFRKVYDGCVENHDFDPSKAQLIAAGDFKSHPQVQPKVNNRVREIIVDVHQKMFPDKWCEQRGEIYLVMVHQAIQKPLPFGGK